MADIKDRIIELREKAGLTQEQFAQEFKVAKSTVSMWEQGNRIPRPSLLQEICDYFNIDLDYLIGRSDIPNKYKEDLKYNWELTEAEKEEIIKEIINKARSRNINIGTIKKNYNLNAFDTKIDTNILYKIAKDYQINSNKGKFLNKIIKKESEIKKWFYNEINSMSDDELREFKTILEYIKNKNK